MNWIKSIIGRITKPHPLFVHTKGSYWTVAKEEEFLHYMNPLEIYLYEMVFQNSWGVWERSGHIKLLSENRYQYAIEHFTVV